MPNETKAALDWAKQQKDINGDIVSESEYVDYVRLYFNNNSIQYSTFSFDDLKPYLI